jgi:ribA/ribD-fused uncharacterized protein
MGLILIFTVITSAFACNLGEVITTSTKLRYECDKSVLGLGDGWRDPRGIVWGKNGQKDCEKFGARKPTEKELKIHNEELAVHETGDRCVKSVIHHYHKFPRTPATPFTGKELDFYREEDAYGEFSNFSGFPVFMDGEWWSTSEHYYQAQKYETQNLQDWVHFAPTPMEAANRGRDPKVPKRKDWDQVKDGFMEKVLMEKFNRHPELKELLLSTKKAQIFEHTTNDCYWADCGNRTGKNRLGVLLMKVRDSLR